MTVKVWPPDSLPPDQKPTPPPPSAAELRVQAFLADTSRQQLIQQLINATPAQIDTWINNRVTDLASARAVLAMLIKVLAIVVKQ